MTSSKLTFGKARRLRRHAEFDQVRLGGRKFRGPLFSLGILHVDPAGRFRAGFVTSRKIGSAVVRNRVRRRLRELVRQYQHHLPDGLWLVVIASPDAATASYTELEAEWLRLAKRASILAA